MRNEIILFVIILFLSQSCKKEQPVTIVNENGTKWQVDTEFNKLAVSSTPLIYEDLVLYSWNTTLPGDTVIWAAYNKHTGEKIWKWEDYVNEYYSYPRGYEKVLFENLLVFPTARGLYAINIETGVTEWSFVEERSRRPYIFKSGSSFYTVASIFGRTKYCVEKRDIRTGNLENEFCINQEGAEVPSVSVPKDFKNADGETILIYGIGIYNFEEAYGRGILNFRNETNNEEEYQEELLNHTSNTNGMYLDIEKGCLFVGGTHLAKYDINTYEKLWEIEHLGGSGSIGFLSYKDKLIHGTEGFSPKLYAYDQETGNKEWELSVPGTCGQMVLYDSLIYFSGGGKIHVVNPDTGELLEIRKSPDFDRNNDAFFDQALAVDPETGRIYTANYISAICYESFEE